MAGGAPQAAEVTVGKRRWGVAGGSALGPAACAVAFLRAWGLPDAPLRTQRGCRTVQGGQFRLAVLSGKEPLGIVRTFARYAIVEDRFC